MDAAIGGSIGYALGIAISPIPIAALIMVLLSVRPRANSLAFTAGWILGIGCVAAIAILTPLFDAGDDPSDRRGWSRFGIGLILVLAAIGRWRTRPSPHDEPPIPPMMRAVDGAGTVGMVGIGWALAALNPKDMLLAAAGGAQIGSADLSRGPTLVAFLMFTAVAASTAVGPVGAYLVLGERLDDRLHRSRRWLIRHNPTVMAVVLLAIGALFIAEGLHILRS